MRCLGYLVALALLCPAASATAQQTIGLAGDVAVAVDDLGAGVELRRLQFSPGFFTSLVG